MGNTQSKRRIFSGVPIPMNKMVMKYFIFLVLNLALVTHPAAEESWGGSGKGPKNLDDLAKLLDILDKRFASAKEMFAIQSAMDKIKNQLSDVKLKIDGNVKTSCTTEHTDWWKGNMDRLTVRCSNNNQVLSHWQLQTNGSGSIRYEYTCCSLHI